ncbi:INVOLVED IN DE NOVO 2-like [Olea europaea subsp. europaea]|uniref:INVOLVED IN DE NOVO 2-like n=1 Tax=Olea europaea subsp. europaea TaxID=158383 RepID=A0A8S0UWM3_OLEEU|nr:INVOLVED IN DE NOVO 2-like [Olea europaea subsp. europaea]
MSYSSEDETDISESELDDYVDRCYEQLKNAPKKVQYSDELFRCPYCPGKKKLVYPFKDLFQHASDVGSRSMNREIKDKGKHLGLVRYLKKDIGGEDIPLEFAGLAIELPRDSAVNDLFVWPWMGILANVDVECRDGVYLDVSSSRLRNDLASKGFNPVRVRLLREKNQCRYAIVEFKKDWSGFYNAMMFENNFEADHHGKKEFHIAPYLDDNKLYGWVARNEDFKSEGVFGDFLRKNGDLMSVADVESQEIRKTGQLISNLTNTVDVLKARLDEIETSHPDGHGNIGCQKAECTDRLARVNYFTSSESNCVSNYCH